ncbi:putative signal peptide protein [Puccinia sorghi]|uniref:Putative signal peptide protein n=1 Tax=Puccinia sorghi TaxID=27349 RepID=A0A0L6V1K0_9BASI|nr:putative signal peptide protein [Puccinia sorghi]
MGCLFSFFFCRRLQLDIHLECCFLVIHQLASKIFLLNSPTYHQCILITFPQSHWILHTSKSVFLLLCISIFFLNPGTLSRWTVSFMECRNHLRTNVMCFTPLIISHFPLLKVSSLEYEASTFTCVWWRYIHHQTTIMQKTAKKKKNNQTVGWDRQKIKITPAGGSWSEASISAGMRMGGPMGSKDCGHDRIERSRRPEDRWGGGGLATSHTRFKLLPSPRLVDGRQQIQSGSDRICCDLLRAAVAPPLPAKGAHLLPARTFSNVAPTTPASPCAGTHRKGIRVRRGACTGDRCALERLSLFLFRIINCLEPIRSMLIISVYTYVFILQPFPVPARLMQLVLSLVVVVFFLCFLFLLEWC